MYKKKSFGPTKSLNMRRKERGKLPEAKSILLCRYLTRIFN